MICKISRNYIIRFLYDIILIIFQRDFKEKDMYSGVKNEIFY